MGKIIIAFVVLVIYVFFYFKYVSFRDNSNYVLMIRLFALIAFPLLVFCFYNTVVYIKEAFKTGLMACIYNDEDTEYISALFNKSSFWNSIAALFCVGAAIYLAIKIYYLQDANLASELNNDEFLTAVLLIEVAVISIFIIFVYCDRTYHKACTATIHTYCNLDIAESEINAHTEKLLYFARNSDLARKSIMLVDLPGLIAATLVLIIQLCLMFGHVVFGYPEFGSSDPYFKNNYLGGYSAGGMLMTLLITQITFALLSYMKLSGKSIIMFDVINNERVFYLKKVCS